MTQEGKKQEHAPHIRLSQEAIDLIILLLAVNPAIHPRQIQAIVEDKFDEHPTHRQIRHHKDKNAERIAELRKDSKLTVELGLELGLIGKYSSKLSRIAALERIIEKGTEGDYEEAQTAKGEVVALKKLNLPAALSALKQLKDELGDDSSDDHQVSLNINLAVPPLDEDEDDEEAE